MAGRPCTICEHPERGSIDSDWLTGQGGLRSIAKRYSVSASSLLRHTENHIAETTKSAVAALEARADTRLSATVAHSAELVLSTEQRVEATRAPLLRALALLEDVLKPGTTVGPLQLSAFDSLTKATSVLLKSDELVGRARGELSTVTTQVAVINSAADFLASPALPAETARAQQACADAVMSAWKDAVTRLGTAEDYAEADAEGLRRLDAKIAELAGGVSGKGGRR